MSTETGADAPAAPAPAPRPRRGLLWIAVGAVVVVAVYVTVAVLYAISAAGSTSTPISAANPQAVVVLSPQSMDAAGNRLTLSIDVQPGDSLTGGGLFLTKPLTLLISDVDGPRTITFAAGQAPSVVSVKVITSGLVEQWPFDRYAVSQMNIALAQTADDGTTLHTVPVSWQVSDRVPGWNVEFRGQPDSTNDEVLVTDVAASRSTSTVAFAIVLITLMLVLPALALTVAISAFRGRRKTEATLLSWIGAMLFAIVPLRGFFPGSPPIGSWVDYLVVLWVVAGLIAALVVFVAAWMRWVPGAGERPVR